jgi:hypothetical protein
MSRKSSLKISSALSSAFVLAAFAMALSPQSAAGSIFDEAPLGRPSARAAITTVTQRHKSAAVVDERAKAFVPPAQRTAFAMEIEKNRPSLARLYMPDDYALAIGGIEHHLFSLW